VEPDCDPSQSTDLPQGISIYSKRPDTWRRPSDTAWLGHVGAEEGTAGNARPSWDG